MKKGLQLAGLALGISLFALLVYRAQPLQLLSHLKEFGLGFAAVLAVSSLSHGLRTLAWWVALGAGDDRAERSPVHSRGRLAPWPLFLARLSGEAVGQVSAFGPLFGEPVKVYLLGGQVGLAGAASSLIVERILFTLVTFGFMLLAVPLAVLALPLSPEARTLLGLAALLPASGLLLAAAAVRGGWPRLSRAARALGLISRRLGPLAERLEEVERRVYEFHREAPGSLRVIGALELTSLLAGALELPLILFLLGSPIGLLPALVLEAGSKLLMASSVLVPGGFGIFEAGTVLLLGGLSISGPTALAAAVVRRARGLCWTGAGLLSLAWLTREGRGARLKNSEG